MKSFIFFLFLLYLNTLSAQFSPVQKGKASLARFFETNTYVVLTEDDCVNEQLKRHFSESWQLTPVQFIMNQEFETFFKDPSLSFVFIEDFKVQGDKKLVGAMALFNGGFTDRDLIYLNSSLAYVAYDNHGLEKNIGDICMKIPAMLNQLQETVKLVNDNNIQSRSPEETIAQLSNLYNSKAAILKKKTILVNQRYKNTKIISVPEFESLYKYDIQFVSADEIERAIANHEAGKAILFSSYNVYKINMVMDCSTHDIVFCEFEEDDKLSDHRLNQIDDGDMKLLNATVKKAKEF